MALLDYPAGGSSPIKGYTNTQIVQRAVMAHPIQPLEMFGAARIGLAVNNDVEVYQFDIILEDDEIHTAFEVKDIADAFKVGNAKLRYLFWNFGINADTHLSILYGADEYSGTYLISIMRNSRATVVTYVSTKQHDVTELGKKMRTILVEKSVLPEQLKA